MDETTSVALGQVRLEDLSPEDVVIVAMGPTGSGKSTFIKAATGREVVITHGLGSCTSDISVFKFPSSGSTSSSIYFVDTPGFDCMNESDVAIFELIAGWLTETYQSKVRLSGLLYFHRISDNRMSGSCLRHLQMFDKLTGSQFKNIVLTTTMWDEVDDKLGRQREDELKKVYWSSMIARGSSTQRFDGSSKSAFNIIAPLIKNTNKSYTLLVQQEICVDGKALHQASAAATLDLKYLDLAKKHQELLSKIQEELKKPVADNDHLQCWMDEYRNISTALRSAPANIKNDTIRSKWQKILQLLRNYRAGIENPSSSERDFSLAQEVTVNDLSLKDNVIILIGVTGAGRSTFIERCTGYDPGIGHGLSSCTQDIKMVKTRSLHPETPGVVLVDTPGFDNGEPDKMPDAKILSMILNLIEKMRRKNVSLKGIVVLHKITDPLPLEPLRHIEKICELVLPTNVIFVTTMWEMESEDEGSIKEARLNTVSWKTKVQSGAQTARLTRADGALPIIHRLIGSAPAV